MNCMYRTLLAAVALAVSSVTASAETITVCASGCDYTSINTAISAASDGDVIQLAAQTYFEGEQIDTLGKAITLRGAFDKTGGPLSVLDGAGSHRVLICERGETSTTIFENLVIQYGCGQLEEVDGVQYEIGGGMFNEASSPTLANCTFEGNSAFSKASEFISIGGGICNSSSNTILTDCTFRNNSAIRGGGVHNFNSNPTLVSCTFTSSSAITGGGLYNEDSSPTLTSCTFTGNESDVYGGGMCNDFSSPTLSNCTFTGNESDIIGGGMYNFNSSSPALTNCTFTNNRADLGGGGGMYNYASRPTLVDCTFGGNSADRFGGGMYNNSSSPALTNCTFEVNSAFNGGGGMYNDGSSIPTLTDSTLCDNAPDQIDGFWTDAGGNCVSISCDDCDLPSDPCPTDLDENGITDGGDLGAFVIFWGECQVDDCPADFNDDEVVDGIDLGILFSAWGPCR